MANSAVLIDEILMVFRQVHGDIPFTLRFVANVVEDSDPSIHGVCDFSLTPPAISIQNDLNETDLIETLFHELAHLVCGYDSGHNNLFEDCKHQLSLRFGAFNMDRLGYSG